MVTAPASEEGSFIEQFASGIDIAMPLLTSSLLNVTSYVGK